MKEWLLTYWQHLPQLMLNQKTWIAIADIVLVYVLIYRGLLLLRGTKAVRTLFGLLLLVIFYTIFKIMGLQTITWIFDQFFNSFVLVVLILFQDEIRRALSRMGINIVSREQLTEEAKEGVNRIVKAVGNLSTSKIGALIVLEREANVRDYIQEGTQLNSEIVEELLYSIFLPYSPLHDGAVLINNNKVISAGCFLPLTQNPSISKNLGTRHRAAIGLTESTDAIVVVVSETDGKISLCLDGVLNRGLDVSSLNNQLLALLDPRAVTGPQSKPTTTTDSQKPSTGPKKRRTTTGSQRRRTGSYPRIVKTESPEGSPSNPQDND